VTNIVAGLVYYCRSVAIAILCH